MRGRALLAFVLAGTAFLRAPDAQAAPGASCGGGGGGGAIDDGGDDSGDAASDDAGVCAANEQCVLPDGGAVTVGAVGTCATLSCGGSNGACPVNVYCGLPDAGIILDGAAGICALEPCVLASDCTNPNLPVCDTSQNPYACVACISSNDCPGILVCDTANHTCVNPPPTPDASATDGATEDGGLVDGAADGSTDAGDAAADGGPGTQDAESSAGEQDGGAGGDASDGSAAGPAPADDGSLAGGAWDCALAPDNGGSLAAILAPLGCAGLFALRRRRKRRPTR